MNLRDLGLGLRTQALAFLAAARRTSPAVLALRGLVLVALLVASALVFPADFLGSRWALGLVALLLACALWPRTPVVDTTLLLLVLVFLAGSSDDVPLWRIGVLAGTLYLAHAGAALAAVLPYDTAVAPPALGRWALRLLGVLGAALAFGLVGLSLVSGLPITPTIAAPVAGALVAAGLAGLLAWLARRRTS